MARMAKPGSHLPRLLKPVHARVWSLPSGIRFFLAFHPLPPLEQRMTRDRTTDIRQRLQCASGHLNAVQTMVEKESPCEEVLHQLHAVEAALKAIGQVLVLNRVEEIESLIKNSPTSEERTEQFQLFVPLYMVAQNYSYLPNDEESA